MSYEFNELQRKTFIVNSEGDVCVSCGGEVSNEIPYQQISPLLPLTRPRREKVLRKKTFHQSRSDSYRKSATNTFLCNEAFVSSRLGNAKVDDLKRLTLEVDDQRNKRFLKQMNLFPPEQCGLENFFNGTCVKSFDNFVLYTGDDGVLNFGKFESSSETYNNPHNNLPLPTISDITSCTEDRLNHSRIYEVDVKTEGTEHLCFSKYQHGFSFFKFDGVTAVNLFSIPCSTGAMSHCFLESDRSCLLDSTSKLSLLDINTKSITMSKYVDCGVENYSWGVVGQGRGENCVSIGSRKSCGLFDLRAGSLETVKTFQDKMYIRGMCADGGYWYISTDETVDVYDQRNLKNRISFPLLFDHSKLVQNLAVQRMYNKSWLFTSTTTGEISLNVLDYSHDNCQNAEQVNSTIKISCVRDKVPDLLGAGRHVSGWNETVTSARLMSDVWLESTVEQRADIEFRGLTIHHKPESNTAGVILVNAIGDLFMTSLSHQIEEEFASTDYREYIEDWGKEVFQHSKMKMIYVSGVGRRLPTKFQPDGKKGKVKRKKLRDSKGMKPVKVSKTNPDLLSPKQLKICPDYIPYRSQKTLNSIKKLDFTKFESGISKKIINILAPHGIESRGAESEFEEEFEEIRPPVEEDPNFALRSFFNELGVPDQSQNELDFSRYSLDQN